jgi:ABC-type dipeptide/oligopeptide/nickel transport system permease subunit
MSGAATLSPLGRSRPLLRGWSHAIAAIGAAGFTVALIVRGQVLALRRREFVLAARALGASHARILFRHVLPNCGSSIVVYATLGVPVVIILESYLSFLGLGVELSGGQLVADGVAVVNPIRSPWWLLVFPSAFLAATLLALNFLGDGLRDSLDPRGAAR